MAANGDDPEIRAIQDLLKKRPLPAAVKGIELEFGEDSTGDPAVWIWLLVDDDVAPSAAKLDELGRFQRGLLSDSIDAGLSHWPYVRFRARQTAEH
jgi:hypothetical protein